MNEMEKHERLVNGVVYLRNAFEGCVVKSSPPRNGGGGKFWVKFSGESPYEVDHSSNLVNDALFEWDEISKEEFDNF